MGILSDQMQSTADPRSRLLELSESSGTSLSRLSALIGRNSSYLQQFIRKGSPKKLEEGDRRTLAEFFGVKEAELGGVEEKSYTPASPYRDDDFIAVPRLSIAVSAGPGRFANGETPFDNFGFSGRSAVAPAPGSVGAAVVVSCGTPCGGRRRGAGSPRQRRSRRSGRAAGSAAGRASCVVA